MQVAPMHLKAILCQSVENSMNPGKKKKDQGPILSSSFPKLYNGFPLLSEKGESTHPIHRLQTCGPASSVLGPALSSVVVLNSVLLTLPLLQWLLFSPLQC